MTMTTAKAKATAACNVQLHSSNCWLKHEICRIFCLFPSISYNDTNLTKLCDTIRFATSTCNPNPPPDTRSGLRGKLNKVVLFRVKSIGNKCNIELPLLSILLESNRISCTLFNLEICHDLPFRIPTKKITFCDDIFWPEKINRRKNNIFIKIMQGSIRRSHNNSGSILCCSTKDF